jgi:hypothetical protein
MIVPFTLVPFPGDTPLPDLQISGRLQRHASILTLHYQLSGDCSQVIAPAPAASPSRQDQLWQTTCFECFLGQPQTTPYWEINLSPAGHWNIYRFEQYRQGMQPETAFTEFPFTVQQRPDCLSLTLSVDLAPLLPVDTSLEVGITAVVQTPGQPLSYWALNHPGEQADFHQRESFTIKLS